MTHTSKNVRLSTDILWRVFHILAERVPYTFVSVNRQNDKAHARVPHIAASSFPRFTDTDIGCTELVPLKYGKLATKYTRIYGYFLRRGAAAV